MTMAASNEQAASLAYEQIAISWAAGTLITTLQQFNAEAQPIFSDAVPNDRPVGNWLILLTAIAKEASADGGSSNISQELFNATVEYVYGMCQCAYALWAMGIISNAQDAALTLAWNNAWGT